jgi:hypothetical protein
MMSTTTIYGTIGAIGTGIAALGTSLAAIAPMAGSPSWAGSAALICGAIGGAISVTAKILAGDATQDKIAATTDSSGGPCIHRDEGGRELR